MAESNVTKPRRVCQESGCDRKHDARGYCKKHYAASMRKGAFGRKLCKAEGCKKYGISKGYCDLHYRQIICGTPRSKKVPNMFEKIGDICLIWLTCKGSVVAKAVIDSGDIGKVEHLKWRVEGGYVVATEKGRSVKLHHSIIGKPKSGFVTDHKDRDRLNNRKTNLRFATSAENAFNTSLNKKNTSGLKGIWFDKSRRKFVARIRINRTSINLGRFTNKYDAALAYDKKAIEVHGDFASTNKDLGLL